MKKSFFPLLGLFLIAPNANAAPTAIAGMVRDGSAGNAPLANAEVQLIRPASTKKKTPRAVLGSVRTDNSGRFAFPPRQYNPDDLLMANTSRGGYDYPAVAFDGAKLLKQIGTDVNPQKVDLLVFNTTKNPVPLDYQAHHVAISPQKTGDKENGKGIHCIERIVVHNHSKATLLGVGPRNVSLLLDIPKGAKNLKLDPKVTLASPGAQLIKTKSGWGIVRPITPDAYGERIAIIVGYDMDWPSQLPWAKKIDLSRKTVYPTKFFFVARTSDEKDLKVSAPKLSPDTEAELPLDGKTEVRLINSIGAPMMPQGGAPPALAEGQQLQIVVSKPVSATFWGFAAMTLALCLFLPVAMIKPRAKNGVENSKKARKVNNAEPSNHALVSSQSLEMAPFSASPNELGPLLALNAHSRDLIQKIADLDDQREAGHIEETEYQGQRAAWKNALLESLSAPKSAS